MLVLWKVQWRVKIQARAQLHLVQATTELYSMIGCCVFQWRLSLKKISILWITDKGIRVRLTYFKYKTHTHRTHQVFHPACIVNSETYASQAATHTLTHLTGVITLVSAQHYCREADHVSLQ